MSSEAMQSSNPDDAPGPLAGRAVKDFANPAVYAVEPDAPLDAVASLMARNSVHAIVVAADEVAEPPMISDADLIGAAGSGHFRQLRARDIAGREAISVHEDATLDEAARMLFERRASHLVVRDRRGYPTGILSTLDVSRALSEGT